MMAGEAMPILEASSWTLIHFLWQGAVVALIVAVTMKALKRRSAYMRYLAACAGMLIMLALPVLTFFDLRSQSTSIDLAAEAQTAPFNVSQASTTLTGSEYSVLAGQPGVSGESSGVDRHRTLSQLAPWVTSLWLFGVVLLSLRMLGGWLYARRLKNGLTWPLEDEWRLRFDGLCRKLRLLRPVRIMESALVQVPTVIGWVKPVVLIPASAIVGLTPCQLEAVVAHELAHIRRYDYLVNLLQTALEIVLFYHPAVWWLSREIRQERENCCDDVAIALCGDRLVYARALTEIEALRNITPQLAMAADGGALLSRIHRILGAPPKRSEHSASWLAGAIVFASVFVPAAAAQFFFNHGSSTEPVALSEASVSASQSGSPAPERLNETPPRPKAPEKSIEKGEPSSNADLERESRAEESSVEETPQSQPGTGSFVDEMVALGYTNLSADDLIYLRSRGVTTALVRELKSYGHERLDVRDLARLASVGVTERYLRDLKASGIDHLSVESLIMLQSRGVSSGFIKGLDDAGYRSLSAAQLSELAGHGVTPAFVRGLQAAGYKDLSIPDLINARVHGVSVEFITEVRESGHFNSDLHELIRMRDHGVTGEFMHSMEAAGFSHLPIKDLINARDHGVDPTFAQKIRAAGYREVTLDQLIRIRDHGVTLDFIDGLRKEDLSNLTLEQLVRLRDHGVNVDFIRRIRSHGFKNLTTDQLIRLHDADIFN